MRLLDFGIGFTDVVKTPSSNAASLKRSDYALWAPRLTERLVWCDASMVCFHGVTGYRAFVRYALDSPKEPTPWDYRSACSETRESSWRQTQPGKRAFPRGRPDAVLR